MEPLLVDLEQLPQEIENFLRSPFLAEPTKKEWIFSEGKVYALIKWVADAHGILHLVFRWAAILPPYGRRMGILYDDTRVDSEGEARQLLAEANEWLAVNVYENFKEVHAKPINY